MGGEGGDACHGEVRGKGQRSCQGQTDSQPRVRARAQAHGHELHLGPGDAQLLDGGRKLAALAAAFLETDLFHEETAFEKRHGGALRGGFQRQDHPISRVTTWAMDSARALTWFTFRPSTMTRALRSVPE